MEKYDVVALGELLIDLTQNGYSGQGNPLLEANPGGAPCNVLALLTKLGHSTAFIGKVGKDGFGDQLENALTETGISTAGLLRDDQVHTTLAVVHTLAGGDRDFSFYRNPGADMCLHTQEINRELIRQAKIFHFGTLSMTDEPVRSATYAAIAEAEAHGVLRSFDPNLRPPLWRTLDEAKEQVLYGMAHCDILKISDNEIQWLTQQEDFDAGVRWIRQRSPISVCFCCPWVRMAAGATAAMPWRRSRAFLFLPLKPPGPEIPSSAASCTMSLPGACGTTPGRSWRKCSPLPMRQRLWSPPERAHCG